MESTKPRSAQPRRQKTYVFDIVLEPDAFASGESAWTAYCPDLPGTTTFGKTKEEALRNVNEVVQMTIEGMIEDGEPIPASPLSETDAVESKVIVTV